MILKFTTKRDINGNRCTLEVNTNNNTFIAGYNTSHCYDDYITINKTDRSALIEQLKNAGFKRV